MIDQSNIYYSYRFILSHFLLNYNKNIIIKKIFLIDLILFIIDMGFIYEISETVWQAMLCYPFL